jgi:Flp pilus assembly protein TadD
LTLCLVVRARVLGPGAEPLFTLSAGPWIATIALVVARYVTLLMLPLGLDAHYPYPPMSGVLAPMALTAATMIVVLVIGISLLRKRSPRGLFWAAWIFVTLAPVMALGRFGDVLMADRFLYLPSVGLSLLAALFVAHLIETEASPLRVRALAAFCVVLVLGWGAISFQRARVWKDNLALFSDMVETSPEAALVRNNLGLALYERGDTADALEEFELAVRLSPGYALAHNNLGAALEREGRSTEALQHYRTALELAPGHVDAAANAGNLLVRLGRRSEGLRLLHELAKQHPGSTNALYARADALNRAGRPAEALSLLERVRKIDPAHPETHYLLGKIRFEEGRVTEAASSMRRFLELWDDEGPHAEAARRVIGQAQTPAGG